MDAKIVRPQVVEIQKRFFEALDMLISSGKIRGLQTFCDEYKLHRPKYSNIKNHLYKPSDGTGYKFIDIDALSYLVADYGISSDWLLLGKDGMFKTKKGGV
jgi:hypothetical protein